MYNYGSILSRYAKLASVGNLLSLALSVTIYVFLAIGLYTLATRRGIKSAWLAWLPIGNMWIIGSLADHYRFVAENRVTKYRKILLGFTIAVAAVSIIVVPIALYFLVMAFSYGFGGGYYDDSILKMTGLILLLFLLSMVLLVLGIILAVFEYISLHKIFKSCDPSNATVFTVLSLSSLHSSCSHRGTRISVSCPRAITLPSTASHMISTVSRMVRTCPHTVAEQKENNKYAAHMCGIFIQ